MNLISYITIAWALCNLSVNANEPVRVYEATSSGLWRHGAFDTNILADDIQMDHGGILTNVTMALTIKGNQDCRFWIFDGLNRPPIYSVAFTNIPSDYTQILVYDFPMHLDVPSKIYVGFSAEGDGRVDEGHPGVDYSMSSEDVRVGQPSSPGFYWYGSISGGVLDHGINLGKNDFFWMRVDMIRPEISSFEIANQFVRLEMSEISRHAIYEIGKSENLASNTWDVVGEFGGSESTALWGGAVGERHLRRSQGLQRLQR